MLELLISKLVQAGRLSDLDTQRESDGQTAYHQACFWNRKTCAMALVKAGCDTGVTEKYGKVGRQMAASRKLKELVAALDALGVVKEVCFLRVRGKRVWLRYTNWRLQGEGGAERDGPQPGQVIGSQDAKA